MIEAGLVALILADPATAALIADRLFPVVMPDRTAKPAVTFREISAVEENTLDGPLGLVKMRWQIDCWGETLGTAKAVSRAIGKLLNEYAGILPNGCEVSLIQSDGRMSGFDQVERAFYAQSDWLIQYTE